MRIRYWSKHGAGVVHIRWTQHSGHLHQFWLLIILTFLKRYLRCFIFSNISTYVLETSMYPFFFTYKYFLEGEMVPISVFGPWASPPILVMGNFNILEKVSRGFSFSNISICVLETLMYPIFLPTKGHKLSFLLYGYE